MKKFRDKIAITTLKQHFPKFDRSQIEIETVSKYYENITPKSIQISIQNRCRKNMQK